MNDVPNETMAKQRLLERFPAFRSLGAQRKRIPFVAQMAATDCGAACLSMALGYHGKYVGLEEVRSVLGAGSGGATARGLLEAARYFGLQQTRGTVAPGRTADLVLLDANPLTDITNVQRIRAVVVAGRFLDRKELDQLLARVKAEAKQ